MIDQALQFLIDTLFGIVTYALLLRFVMQWLRAPFRNPLAQAVVALTDWAVKPMRRVLPAFSGLDTSSLFLAWVAQFAWLVALRLVASLAGFGVATAAMLAVLACIELLKAALWLLVIAVFVQALLSWVSADGPLAGVLNALTFRFLSPIRRRLPLIGGTLDLSPLILIVIVQLVLMLPVRWLEGFVAALFR